MNVLTRNQWKICLLIGIVTVISGLSIVVLPGVALDVLDAESTVSTRMLFQITGMFTALFGGLQWHATRTNDTGVAMRWCTLQKLGATIAMSVAVARDVFNPLALLVAAFDGVSAWLIWTLHRTLSTTGAKTRPAAATTAGPTKGTVR